MVKPIMRDPLFLAQKSELATEADRHMNFPDYEKIIHI